MGMRPHTGRPVIGIVGGVGPHAGYDLALKILEETSAAADREHIPLVLVSDSDTIGDRTAFLLGEVKTNPGMAIGNALNKLERAGATVAGIPCNTAHAAPIWSVATQALKERPSKLHAVNMITEVGLFIREKYPTITRVGLLSTLGTARSAVYRETLEPMGLGVVLPDERTQRDVHQAVYNPEYGIKAQSQPVSNRATGSLTGALEAFRSKSISMVILGCTEIPLALPVPSWKDIRLIDATRVLARALIRETYPEKLRRL